MATRYGTAAAERIILRTPPRLRVGFRTTDRTAGTQTVYALHPVTREIRARTNRIDADDWHQESWREAHHVPPGAEYIGHCVWP